MNQNPSPRDAATPARSGPDPAWAVTVPLPTAAATTAWGATLAGRLRAGDLLILSGGLGAGKTTLTQGIGAGLAVRGRIASPTFIIARSHAAHGDGPALVHVDAYRLTSLAEVDDLDLDASMAESVTVVEWGEGMVEDLAADRLEIELVRARGAGASPDADPQAEQQAEPRIARVRGYGPRWSSIDISEVPR